VSSDVPLTPDLAGDGGDLSPEARVFLHFRDLHQAPGGLPLRVWELADQYAGCKISEASDEEFTAFMNGDDCERYLMALHQAAHDISDLNHDRNMI
jgi:hypothetical protein